MKKKFLSFFLIAVTAISGLFFAGCAFEEAEVQEIAESFTKALFTGDIDTIKAISTPATITAAESLASLAAANAENKEAEYMVTDCEIEGDNAVVEILVVRPVSNDTVVTVPLVKTDGEWKVTWTKTHGGMKTLGAE